MEDSDSDLEDMKHMLEESRKQLQVADTVLKKPRNDAMGTGIFLHPQKYVRTALVYSHSKHPNISPVSQKFLTFSLEIVLSKTTNI